MTKSIATASIDADGEVLPGIRAELHPGHTPGTAFYVDKQK